MDRDYDGRLTWRGPGIRDLAERVLREAGEPLRAGDLLARMKQRDRLTDTYNREGNGLAFALRRDAHRRFRYDGETRRWGLAEWPPAAVVPTPAVLIVGGDLGALGYREARPPF